MENINPTGTKSYFNRPSKEDMVNKTDRVNVININVFCFMAPPLALDSLPIAYKATTEIMGTSKNFRNIKYT